MSLYRDRPACHDQIGDRAGQQRAVRYGGHFSTACTAGRIVARSFWIGEIPAVCGEGYGVRKILAFSKIPHCKLVVPEYPTGFPDTEEGCHGPNSRLCAARKILPHDVSELKNLSASLNHPSGNRRAISAVDSNNPGGIYHHRAFFGHLYGDEAVVDKRPRTVLAHLLDFGQEPLRVVLVDIPGKCILVDAVHVHL